MTQTTDIEKTNSSNKDMKSSDTSGNNVKTKFQIECETAISIEEAEERLLSFVRNLPWKK